MISDPRDLECINACIRRYLMAINENPPPVPISSDDLMDAIVEMCTDQCKKILSTN
ncbi:MAG: hypothetical protein ACP5LG_06575 [Conexivisphaera sp.]|jgi:predicted RNase H-like nuclease